MAVDFEALTANLPQPLSEDYVGPDTDIWYVDTRAADEVAANGPITSVSASYVTVDVSKGKCTIPLRDAIYLLSRFPDNFSLTAPAKTAAPKPTPADASQE